MIGGGKKNHREDEPSTKALAGSPPRLEGALATIVISVLCSGPEAYRPGQFDIEPSRHCRHAHDRSPECSRPEQTASCWRCRCRLLQARSTSCRSRSRRFSPKQRLAVPPAVLAAGLRHMVPAILAFIHIPPEVCRAGGMAVGTFRSIGALNYSRRWRLIRNDLAKMPARARALRVFG